MCYNIIRKQTRNVSVITKSLIFRKYGFDRKGKNEYFKQKKGFVKKLLSLDMIRKCCTYNYAHGYKAECFGNALQRYMEDGDAAADKKLLCEIIGFSESSLRRYLNGDIIPDFDTVTAICIALQLHPMRAEHLFKLAGFTLERNTDRELIIIQFVYGCFYLDEYTLDMCCRVLADSGFRPLISEQKVRS